MNMYNSHTCGSICVHHAGVNVCVCECVNMCACVSVLCTSCGCKCVHVCMCVYIILTCVSICACTSCACECVYVMCGHV